MNGNRGAIDMGDEIARQRAIGEESGGSSTRRMSMVLDGGDTPAVNGGEQPTAPRDLPPEKSFPISADSHGADCAVRLSTLVEQCRQEIQAYRRGEPSNEAHGLELLHRAIVQGDQAAEAGVQQCLSEIVLGWLRGHPSREAAYRWQSEEDYVALAFERFWQATIQQQVIFRTLAGALVYLRASLHGAILDTLRGCPVSVSSDWPTSSITVSWVPERWCGSVHRSGTISRRYIVCAETSCSDCCAMRTSSRSSRCKMTSPRSSSLHLPLKLSSCRTFSEP